MYIDCHVHCEPDEFRGDPKAFVAGCQERGVEKMVVIESLETCLRAVERFGDFFIPVALIHMDKVGPTHIEDCIRAGCKGIKFIAPRAPYADERYWPLYARLSELGATAVFHTGYVAPLPRLTGEDLAHPTWTEHMRAMQVEVVSRRFPELRIAMAHYSNPWFEEAWKVTWTKDNVWGDLSGGTAIHRSIRFWADLFAPDGQLFEESIRKLCFGSDVFVRAADRFPVEQYITFYNRIFDAIGLSPELRELVNRGNARMLYGLEEE